MKIFFLMKKSGYLRNYASVVRLLAARGHRVQLGFLKIDEIYPRTAIDQEVKDIPGVSYIIPPKRIWLWKKPAEFIRVLQTYLRFLDPYYNDAYKLRARAAAMLPRPVSWLVRLIVGHNRNRLWAVVNVLRIIERSLPLDRAILKFFRSNRPDAFLVTPLIDMSVSQLDWLKCARALGINTALGVASWDNLSNKSLIQIEPDVVLVWNKNQEQEAVEFHRIPAEKIIITGAQCYDRLFERRPSTSGEEFRKKVGLSDKGPYILYLCSSGFIAPREVDFVADWIDRLRRSPDPQLNRIGVLVRPHPQNANQWGRVNFSDHENVAIYPRQGANPIHGDSLNDFFDSMYHSVATIGINTSPMIESGILNKPVLTVLAPQFKDTQNGTIHFHHLVDGGLLNISQDLDEHLQQLSRVLANRKSYQARIKDFIRSFVRPHGLDKECTPIFVEAIENLNQSTVLSPADVPQWWPLVRLLLFPWAAISFTVRRFNSYLQNNSW
ncbi:hypothetical protein D1BOALGB6SA_988 [Olavius sp. associated proteobacterium Delta 1]|nr:hypothetical protein D1BOALGB6SA_988 [Olavius sp. associated proteobacterium Delta 1]